MSRLRIKKLICEGRSPRQTSEVFCYHRFFAGDFSLLDRMQDEDDEIPSISRGREAFMEEAPAMASGSRRNEDIALDLMKFIAMTTGYGRTTGGGVGFQGGGAASKPEEYAGHLLELYARCLAATQSKK